MKVARCEDVQVDARPDHCDLARRGFRQYSGQRGIRVSDGHVHALPSTDRLGGRSRLPAEADHRRVELPGRCGDGEQLHRAGIFDVLLIY